MPKSTAPTITPGELARRWGITEAALATQRAEGRGPAFTREGRFVRYSLKSVLEAERRRDAGLGDDRLLRLTDIIDMTGLSRATLLRWEQDGRFPPGIRLSRGTVRWSARQVDRWIAEVQAA